jgi:hypothetical protein
MEERDEQWRGGSGTRRTPLILAARLRMSSFFSALAENSAAHDRLARVAIQRQGGQFCWISR